MFIHQALMLNFRTSVESHSVCEEHYAMTD